MSTAQRWLPALRGAGSSLRRDLTGGVTLAAIAIPGSMAAAQLVGVSPAVGLLGFLVAAVVFALVGAHRTLSVGPDSSIAPMLAGGAAATAAVPLIDDNGTASLLLLSLLVAVILLLLGVIRGGWITQFLSRPVTTGLLAGVGLSIILSQLPALLGVAGGDGPTWEQVTALVDDLDQTHPATLLVSVGVLVLTFGLSALSSRIPGALLALVAASAVTALLGLGDRGVDMLTAPGPVWQLPDFAQVPWGAWWDLLPTALVIVVLIVVQTGATESATKQGQRTLDRDLAAIGVASAASALVGAFAVNASPPRTRLIQELRGKTQVISLAAAAIALIALLVGDYVLPLLPAAALAAVLVQIAFSLIRFGELRSIAAYSKVEFAVALGTIVLVVALGIVPGVALAALVTLLDRTRRQARPPTYRKGLIPQSNHWVPVDAGEETVQVPSVLVWSVEAPLWYADADYVVRELREEVDEGVYFVLVLDAAAIPDLDYTGARALDTLIDHVLREDIPVLVARANRALQKALSRAGIAEKVRLHPTVADAVKDGAQLAGLRAEFRAARGKKKDLAALREAGLSPEELTDEDETDPDGRD